MLIKRRSKMKLRKSNVFVILLTMLILCGFISCASSGRPFVNSEELKSYPAPSENSGLLFGFIMGESGFLTSNIIGSLEFMQINPELDPVYVYPGYVDGTLHFNPLPVGAKLHLFYWKNQIGRIIYMHKVGIQKTPSTIDLSVEKPGLNFFGAYKLNTEQTFWTIGGSKFVKDDSKTELDALKILKKHLKKTGWEILINERIEELQK
jgi:hypothetical protein